MLLGQTYISSFIHLIVGTGLYQIWTRGRKEELNHLQLNITKTRKLVVDFRKQAPPSIIKGIDVEEVEDYRVHIDSKLDWSKVIDIVFKFYCCVSELIMSISITIPFVALSMYMTKEFPLG